ncbi:MAG: superoxide dismutase, Ni [Zetaproteobacteria bacterium]|nr:superoxide dismutase, Ni [Pseudobdellovibrionaceae bacterium]|tara:strand:+ start:309 stop:800 length:492 start_codon:yes stop_codon:yes gene_type:complete
MIKSILDRHSNQIESVSAHCDIPCKIYDPAPAMIAALTVVRMIDLMEELNAKKSDTLAFHNTMARYVREKEDQATLCKEEVRIIWGDYFKAPQMEKFPEIHEVCHNIMMTASKTKQEPNKDHGLKLVELVNQFSDIFWQTKGVKVKKATCPYPPSLEVVYPDL